MPQPPYKDIETRALTLVHQSLVQKLNPANFTSMSGKMAAIVGCIIGTKYTDTEIVELCITSDRFVLARNKGHAGFDTFIGHETDLGRNWINLLDSADLTNEERALADQLARTIRRI
jgi:hypothetical protein